jgi:hypothetical protein
MQDIESSEEKPAGARTMESNAKTMEEQWKTMKSADPAQL